MAFFGGIGLDWNGMDGMAAFSGAGGRNYMSIRSRLIIGSAIR